MASFLTMLLQIAMILIDVLWLIIIVQFVLSILIAFNVINTYNEFVSGLWRGLNKVTEPMYRPIRRFLPDTHPLDLAPMVVLVLITIVTRAIIPWLASLI